MKSTLTNQIIESLVLNSEDGEIFDGLRFREANRFQSIAWNNGRGVRIEPEDRTAGTYKAVVVG